VGVCSIYSASNVGTLYVSIFGNYLNTYSISVFQSTMITSRSAAYFNKVSKTFSHLHVLSNVVKADAERARNLADHKAELDRIYDLIEKSAKGGGIRVFIAHSDPLWKNQAVQQELRMQGFAVSPNHHSTQGAIEWWHIQKKEELIEMI
jgi:hypothetical protein